jgi:hypothetical protein
MKLNWNGEGQVHHGTPYLLIWCRCHGGMRYILESHDRNDTNVEGRFRPTTLLNFEIPDYSWQDTGPSLYNPTEENTNET